MKMRKISVAVWTIAISLAGAGLAQQPLDLELQHKMQRSQEDMKRAAEELERTRWDKKLDFRYQDFSGWHMELKSPKWEWKAHTDMAMSKMQAQLGFLAQRSPKGRDDEGAYRSGTNHLDRREWERAIEAFDRAIEANGNRTDGALYW
jgi:hypothetical protein